MHIVFTMTSRMIAIVSVCALLLCILVFMAGMQVGSRLDTHAVTASGIPARRIPAPTDSPSPPPAWPTAEASGVSSSNGSGE